MKKNSIEELGLKAVLGIGKQEKCLLLDFCLGQNIDCDGSRVPWCRLETALLNGCDTKIIQGLRKEKIIQVIQKIQKKLILKNETNPPVQFLAGKEDFACPFFPDLIMPCKLNLCAYNSAIVKGTACILSAQNGAPQLSLSEISISKNIPRKKLLQLVFNIEAGAKWERVRDHMDKMLGTMKPCFNCGHFSETCRENGWYCERREGVLKILKHESLVPEKLLSYPMTLIILATYKEFGDWAKHLFPKKALNTYVESIQATYERRSDESNTSNRTA